MENQHPQTAQNPEQNPAPVQKPNAPVKVKKSKKGLYIFLGLLLVGTVVAALALSNGALFKGTLPGRSNPDGSNAIQGGNGKNIANNIILDNKLSSNFTVNFPAAPATPAPAPNTVIISPPLSQPALPAPAAPGINAVVWPDPYLTAGSTPVNISYIFDAGTKAAGIKVDAQIDDSKSALQATLEKAATGKLNKTSYNLTWDGKDTKAKIAPNGVYTLKVTVNYSVPGPVVNGQPSIATPAAPITKSLTFNVGTAAAPVTPASPSTPTVSSLTATPNPFDPTAAAANLQLGYTYANSIGGFVNASIYPAGGSAASAVKSWISQISSIGVNTALTWNGKLASGSTAPDGNYVFEVTPVGGTGLTKTFTITAAPAVVTPNPAVTPTPAANVATPNPNPAVTPTPNANPSSPPALSTPTVSATTYNPYTDNPVQFSYNISNLVIGSTMDVTMQIDSSAHTYYLKQNLGQTNGGPYTLSWNGTNPLTNQIAPSGTYQLEIFGDVQGDSHAGHIASLFSATFYLDATAPHPAAGQVSGPSASVDSLQVLPNPYDLNLGSASFVFHVANPSGATSLSAAVYDVTNTAVKLWTVQNPSTVVFLSWDGNDVSSHRVPSGAYTFRVWGNDGVYHVAQQQVSFSVVNNATAVAAPTTTGSGGSGGSAGSGSSGGSSSSNYAGAAYTGANACGDYGDVAANNPACDAIIFVKSIGAMTGVGDGKNFNQLGVLQRDQIAKIIELAFKAKNKFSSTFDYCSAQNPFVDVTPTDWAYEYLCFGKQKKIVTGYLSGQNKGRYLSSQPVTRAEFLAILLRNLGDRLPVDLSHSYLDVDRTQWFSRFAAYAFLKNLFPGTYLHPAQYMTRVEVAKIIYQLHTMGKI